MHVMLMASPVNDDVVSPPTMSTPQRSQAALSPAYSSSMSSTVNLLLSARLTVSCLGVPFMANTSLMFTCAALYPRWRRSVYVRSKCTPSISRSVVTSTSLSG